MNREERPIVFTISKSGSHYVLASTDRRSVCAYNNISASNLFETMVAIAKEHNDNGYALLFEVD